MPLVALANNSPGTHSAAEKIDCKFTQSFRTMQIKSQKSKKKATKVTELRFHRALFLANGKHLWRENRPAERKRAGKEVPELEIGDPDCRWTVGHSKKRRIHGTKPYHRPHSAENSTERHRPKKHRTSTKAHRTLSEGRKGEKYSTGRKFGTESALANEQNRSKKHERDEKIGTKFGRLAKNEYLCAAF